MSSNFNMVSLKNERVATNFIYQSSKNHCALLEVLQKHFFYFSNFRMTLIVLKKMIVLIISIVVTQKKITSVKNSNIFWK